MSHGPLSDLSHFSWQRAERPWFRVAGAVITLLVFAAGVYGTYLAEGHEVGIVACIYATCKFFLFHGEHSLLSWPKHSAAAVALMSIAAFIGPILTTAVVALLVRQIAAVIRDRQSVNETGHIVILGCGREGFHWGKYLRNALKLPIVFVNRDAEGPQLGQARAISGIVLIGDMRDQEVRRRAAIHESKIVVVCTGNELSNIDTARAIEHETEPTGPRIFCRVVSQSLLFSMNRSARKSASRIRYFNIYDFVANDAIQATPKGTDPVHLIICGFGRFGQAVLHAAGKDADLFRRLSAVHVVDLRANELLEEYTFSAPDADDQILKLAKPNRSGILNHELWTKLLGEPAEALRLVFICTDNDVTNFVHALAIQRLVRKMESQNIRAIVVMRQFERPLISEAGLLYATMGESTDTQIEGLIAEPK